ncbi:hypothetical protein ACF0H5_011757 [Mactra antiquata]
MREREKLMAPCGRVLASTGKRKGSRKCSKHVNGDAPAQVILSLRTHVSYVTYFANEIVTLLKSGPFCTI